MSVTSLHRTGADDGAGGDPILVVVDGSRRSESALAWAANRARESGRRVHIVHRGPLPPMGDAPGVGVTSELVPDAAALELLRRSECAAVVVVASHSGERLRGAPMGSVSDVPAGRARCPVVVVPPGAQRHVAIDRVVVGLDGSATSAGGLDFAMQTASGHGARVTALMASMGAFSEDEHQHWFAEALALVRGRFPGIDVVGDVVRANPVATLVAESTNADLVVIGARRRSRLRGLLSGSVGHAVLHQAPCPVAVVGM